LAIPGANNRKGVEMKQSREISTVLPVAKKGPIAGYEMTVSSTEGKKQTKPITKEGDLTMETKTAFTGFDPMHVSENVIKMMKYSFDTTFDNITKIQEFNDKIVKDMIKTNKQVQAEAEKFVDALSESGKKGWDEYKKVVEKGFKQTEGLVQPAK
jgi:polyhydroxyalkanoate synthesis regulator phasin